jgi:predicted metal-binding membrane protein
LTPAARERWQVRIPLLAAAAGSWAILAGAGHSELAAFCSTTAAAALSFDRLAFAVAFAPFGDLAWEWGLMIAAMMLPMLTGPVGHIRARSLPRRRWQAVAIFMAGYCTIWLLCGVPIMMAMLAVRAIEPVAAFTTALVIAIAVVWQCSPAKQFCLNRCHSQPPLAAYGIRADIDALKYGVTQGIWCCGTCWAVMFIPLTTPGHHLIAMAAASAFLTAERLERPQRPGWSIRWPATIFRLLWFHLKQILPTAARADPLG